MIDNKSAFIPVQDFIDKSLRDKENNKPKKEITSWHASQIGSCMRGIYLNRLGKAPDSPLDDRTLRIFDMGNKIEDWIVNLIKLQGIDVETQVRVEDKKLNLTGYADAVIKYKNEREVLEIKSKHSKAFWWMDKKGQGAQRHHMYQLWLYLYILKIDRGVIVYVSKDDSAILQYVVFRNDATLKKEVMNILDTLNNCWEKKILPPLPERGSWEEKYCGHHKQCIALEKGRLLKLK